MRIAYADPPYIGRAKRLYKDDPNCHEVNHRLLIAHLEEFDGWALSCASSSLDLLLPLTRNVRVAAWCKTFVSACGPRPYYAWEPVVFRPARRASGHINDWLACRPPVGGLMGRKPEEFAFWLFAILGARGGDEFHDIFPGSGGVTLAWEKWRRQTTFEVGRPPVERPMVLDGLE